MQILVKIWLLADLAYTVVTHVRPLHKINDNKSVGSKNILHVS